MDFSDRPEHAALRRASAYAKDRTVWDAPIGSRQGVSHALAKAAIEPPDVDVGCWCVRGHGTEYSTCYM